MKYDGNIDITSRAAVTKKVCSISFDIAWTVWSCGLPTKSMPTGFPFTSLMGLNAAR